MILSEEESRVYTINLSKVLLSPENRRTKRAINMIKEFATRHMKSEEIKIDEELNKQMWQNGIRHPPRRVRVKMSKDEDGVVTVLPYSEEVKEEIVEEKPVAVEAAAPAATTETVAEVAAEKPEQEVKVPEAEELEEKVEEVVEVKEEKRKPEKEEPEKIVLSEEELAEIIAEEMDAEGEEKEADKGKRRKRSED